MKCIWKSFCHIISPIGRKLTYGASILLKNWYTFKGYWTLPGGHVDFGERLEEAVCREILEETGIIARVIGLIDIFAQPDRDPWGHIISIAFLLTLNDSQSESNNFDLNEVGYWKWFSINKLPKKIGFDHIEMIKKAQIKYPKHF